MTNRKQKKKKQQDKQKAEKRYKAIKKKKKVYLLYLNCSKAHINRCQTLRNRKQRERKKQTA